MPRDTPGPVEPVNGPLLALSAFVVVLQVSVTALGRDYGYFIDEFYYIACARHLAFGYVDHPPFTPLVLAAWKAVFGTSLHALRLPAFLAAGLTVFATGRMALELGGSRAAALIAALAVAVAPGLLGMTGFYSVNAFEAMFWALCAWTIVRLIATGNPRLWLLFGLLAGLGIENKHTIVSFALAVGAALLVTDARRLLWNRWLVAGAAIAAALALPNVVWQVMHGWPSLEFYREAAVRKNLPSPSMTTLVMQLLLMGPGAAVLWLVGLGWLLVGRNGSRWRAFGIAYVILLVMLVISEQSRPDRLLGIYPVLLAAGSVAITRVVRLSAARAALAAGIVMTSAFAWPLVIPVLPPERLAPFVAWLGFQTSGERGKTSPIPQLLADRTGWESFVDDVARAYATLSEDERRVAVIFAPSYGQAGAIELLGPSRGLTGRVISGQNTYYHWSEGVDAPVLIAVDPSVRALRSIYADVRQVGVSNCTYCMSWRNDNPIFVARKPTARLSSVWPRARHYE